MKKSISIFLSTFVLLIFITFAFLNIQLIYPKYAAIKDAEQYATGIVSLVESGTFALEKDSNGKYLPGFRREPGYSIFAAPFAAIFQKSTLVQECAKDVLNCDQKMVIFIVQYVLLFLCALLSFDFVKKVTGNRLFSSMTFLLVVSNISLWQMTNKILTETITTFLLLLFSWLLYHVFRKQLQPIKISQTVTLVLTACFTYSYLVFTRSTFLYFTPFVVGFVLYYIRYKMPMRPIQKVTFALVSVCMILSMILFWYGRNYTHFGQIVFSGRGSEILGIRAQYITMTKREFVAYWKNAFFHSKYKKNATVQADLVRFSRTNLEGFNKSGKHGAIAQLHAFGTYAQSENTLRSLYVRQILARPFKHLLVSTVTLYNGIGFPNMHGFLLNRDYRYIPLSISFFWEVLILFGVWAGCLFLKNYSIALFFSGSIYSVLFYALLSHNIPRYNFIVIPQATIALVLLFFIVWIKIKKVWANRSQMHPSNLAKILLKRY